MIKPGSIYLHYKNKLYNVIDIINISDDEHVLYSSMYYPKKAWIRPKSMFMDGRFTYVADNINNIDDYYKRLDNLGFIGNKQ